MTKAPWAKLIRTNAFHISAVEGPLLDVEGLLLKRPDAGAMIK